jgi:hypothetical protein
MKIPIAFIEPLESRIAPAHFGFVDVDGDKVTVNISSPSYTFTTAAAGVGFQLTSLTITAGTHVNVSVSVTSKGPLGDGQVNVGVISGAAGVTFGSVSVEGDLARIAIPGTGAVTDTVIKSLTVHSMGEYGTATGATANGNGTVQSVIGGSVGSLNVLHDINGSLIEVLGKLGAVSVKGSLVGGSTANSGEILTSLAMGPVKIGGSIDGGGGQDSGAIQGNDGIASVTVGKSVEGSSGAESGYILNNSSQPLGPVKIGGSLEGGTEDFSGTINSFGNMGAISIGGSMIGAAADSGSIFMQLPGGKIASVNVAGSVIGGSDSSDAGTIAGSGSIGAVTIGGSLTRCLNQKRHRRRKKRGIR